MTLLFNPSNLIYTLDGGQVADPTLDGLVINQVRPGDQKFFRNQMSSVFTFKDADYTYLAAKNIIECPAVTTITIKQKCTTTGSFVVIYSGTFSTKAGIWDLGQCRFKITVTATDDYTPFFQKEDNEYNILALGLDTQTVTGGGITYNRPLLLKDVIEYIVNDIDGISYDSQFFDALINPLTTTNPNPLNDTMIAQKSDIITPAASNPATVGILTFKELMLYIRNVFNSFWYIDSNNVFRIEHVRYFENNLSYSVAKTVGTNLVTLDSGVYLTNKTYEWNSAQTPNRERFKFMEANALSFIGSDIIYDAACLDRGSDLVKEYLSARITTDVDYIQNFPAKISTDGFVFLNIDTGPSPSEIIENITVLNTEVFDRYGEFLIDKYDVFTPSGRDVACQNIVPLFYAVCYIAITPNQDPDRSSEFIIGDQFELDFDFVLSSGTAPNVLILDAGLAALSNTIHPAPGHVTDTLTISTSGLGYIAIQTGPGISTDFEINNITITKKVEVRLNGHFGFFALQENYWKYNRFFATGNMNNTPDTAFLSVVRKRIQKDLKFPVCCFNNFDPEKLIRTNIDDGELDESSYNLLDNQMDIKVLL